MPVVRIAANCVLLIVASAILFLSKNLAAEPHLEVRLASGRIFYGAMDVTSTSERLMLRSERDGITVRRPVDWLRIVEVKSDGVPTEVAKLREMSIPQEGTVPVEPTRRVERLELRGDPPPPEAPHDDAVANSPLELQPARVAMLAFDARIANWDADLETDGLLIDVAPLDIDGQIVAVGGTVEVELYARQRRTLDQAPQSGGDTLELVERWTQTISSSQRFNTWGARLRLPFAATHPELDLKWMVSSYGLVHVRLVIPGHGVFEDSRDAVRLRPFAPNRDRLQLNTGYRFLPSETLGRPN